MNDGKLRLLVTESVSLDREIRDLTIRLNELKKQIIEEGRTREDEHVPTDGGGTAWQADGTDGCVARVSYPAASLKSSIPGIGKAIEKIMQVAGKSFHVLFQKIPAWKPCENFRQTAVDLLGGKEGKRMIRLCETDSAPRVNFETKLSEVEA